MATILLIRHALTDAAGRMLAGTAAGVHLNAEGREQARRLPERLAAVPLAAIYASPLERAIETAAPLAAHAGVEVSAAADLNELEFGGWTGRAVAELAGDRVWQQFNSYRSGTRIPGGESMLEVQARAVLALDAIRRAHDRRTVAVITHGDVIRAVLAHYAAIPLDLCLRIQILPASISAVRLSDDQPQIILVNDSGSVAAAVAG